MLPWLAVAATPRACRMRAVMLVGITLVVSMLVLAVASLVGHALHAQGT